MSNGAGIEDKLPNSTSILFIDKGTRLPGVEAYLNAQGTLYRTYPFRDVVEHLGGTWKGGLERPRGQFETLNITIPRYDGILIIESPWSRSIHGKDWGHRVSFTGEVTPDLERDVEGFFSALSEANSYSGVEEAYNRYFQTENN
ncbi:hypothetical protein JYT91_01280 [archaeon AH-315-M20]|nr:hypothetical protein [archaeon AH-315-M20]